VGLKVNGVLRSLNDCTSHFSTWHRK